MASNLERVGVILVAEGIGNFMSALTDVGAKVTNFMSDAISKAGDFEAGMNRFGAAAGEGFEAGTPALKEFQSLFLDLGKKLPVSTQEVQDAAIALVKGGLDPLVVKAGALESSLNFAAAAEMGLADAAELTIKQLGTFLPLGASVEEQTRFMANAQDLLVKAAGASSLNVDRLGDAMLGAGGAAKASGVDYQDFVTTMGLISPAFKNADQAGTSYKNFLARLIPTTKNQTAMMIDLGLMTEEGKNKFFDATGAFVGNRQAAEMLRVAISGLADEQRADAVNTIFGNDAKDAALALMSAGAEGYDVFAAKMEAANGVAGQAAIVNQGLNFSMDNLKGSLEAFQIMLGTKVLPLLTPFVDKLNAAVGVVMTLTDVLFGNKAAIEQLPPVLGGIVGALSDAGLMSSEFAESMDVLGQRLGMPANMMQNIVLAVQGVISSFEQGGAGALLLGTYVDTLRERWNVLLPVITMVAEGVWAVVSRVFGAVQTFLERHGDEVLGFITTTWTAINSIINDVMQIVAIVVGDKLQKIAAYFDTYGAEIQTIMTVAWNIVSGVITTALNLIQGIVRATLQAVQGDWSGAWTTIQNMSARFVATINNAIQSFLDKIAGAFGTSLAEIRATWSNNWDMLVQIATKVVDRVKDVGSKIVNAIKSGFENAWSDFIASAQGKLQEFRDMLPFSEPKDHSSPLYGLNKSGEALVNNLAKGVNANVGALLSAAKDLGAKMIAQFGNDGKKAADALTSSMRDALDFRASIPRAMDSIDDFLKGVGERLRQTGMYSNVTEDVQRQVQQALLEAQKLSPKDAAQFFKLRTDQIKEMTALQEQLFTATDAERGSLTTRIARIFEAQKLELQSFLSQIEGGGGIVSPPATLAQLLTGSNTVTNYGPQINYSPSYASGPQSPNYDYAVLQALTP